MTDRELLEAAAKAAGHGEVWYLTADGRDVAYIGPRYVLGQPVQYRTFDPLTDDGDAFRLAVRLGIGTRHHIKWSQVFSPQTGVDDFGHDDDPYAATRRAIVRAAAAMGADK